MGIKGIRISLASPEKIREWSRGEVKKAETINYRTLKPERDGLFCERIFGPTKDYECYCGKYKKAKYKGVVCEKCGVEVTESKVRRERMGHIELAAPVVHIWYLKGIPSMISQILDVPTRDLERVVYFASLRRLEPLYKVVNPGSRKGINLYKGDLISQSEFEIHKQFNKKFVAEEAYRVKWTDDIVVEPGSYISEEEVNRYKERYGESSVEVEPCFKIVDVVLGADVPYKVGDIISATELENMGKQAKDYIKVERFMHSGKEMFIVNYVAKLPFKKDDIISSRELRMYSYRYPGRFEVEKENVNIEDPAYIVINPGNTSTHKGQILLEREVETYKLYDKSFEAGMGAEAIKRLLEDVDLEALASEIRGALKNASKQKRSKLIKRLEVVNAFIKSGNRPEWMVLEVLPVIPPDLRPMVQLDGGRFASSDLNDLYRRVINRNIRLKKLIDLRAPDIIVKSEKRMLQESVDALIDNGRRGKMVVNASGRPLKSLSDMLSGKKGRFRQNLLGKRVDYSGRSVIVVGPKLKLHQCGLPRQMALELFKPFVMNKLTEKGFVSNIKSARKMIEKGRPEVWDVLEEVIKEHPVLLNRAPTLHRLGIQAFEPVLIEGKAIQIHPLVCTAFNADFDGDQMAVHVPLSIDAQAESRLIMLSSRNLLSPAHGGPIVTPTQDMVLGMYYMTLIVDGEKGEGSHFYSFDDALTAYEYGKLGLHARIKVRTDNGLFETTVGRILFNEALPKGFEFVNNVVDKKKLLEILREGYEKFGPDVMVGTLDALKELGFHMATKFGLTISITDVKVPKEKWDVIDEAHKSEKVVAEQYNKGIITDDEREEKIESIWTKAADTVADVILRSLDELNPLKVMVKSGARGSVRQLTQMAGMRGLMANPSGKIIEYPILSNFREGLSVLEYFISTHGARKGLADTALRTSKSGYLTRRLIDVAQDIMVTEEDCGTTDGIYFEAIEDDFGGELMSLADRITGRYAAEDVKTPEGEIIVHANEEITKELAKKIKQAGIKKVKIRSPLTCKSKRGICAKCYGRDLALGRPVNIGEAVGIVSAQSIGEPGTQLTLRTFHTGGIRIKGEDITQGLPRVEQLFELRKPKREAIISEIDGIVSQIKDAEKGKKLIIASLEDKELSKVYNVPSNARIIVDVGDEVEAGQQLTTGYIDPNKLLDIKGLKAVQKYIVDEVQKVYLSQGVTISDKHIEVITRKIAPPDKVKIIDEGDTELLPGYVVCVDEFNRQNALIGEMNERIEEEEYKEIVGRKVLGFVKDRSGEVEFLKRGEELSPEAFTKIISVDSPISEIELDMDGIDVKYIIGEMEFKSHILEKVWMDGLDLSGRKNINSQVADEIISKIKGAEWIVTKDVRVLKSFVESVLAEDVVDEESGELIASANTVLERSIVDKIAKSNVSSVKVWRKVESLYIPDLLHKAILDKAWGKEIAEDIVVDETVIARQGSVLEPTVVDEILENGVEKVVLEDSEMLISDLRFEVLSDIAYGNVLTLPAFDAVSGEVVLPAGQELNQKAIRQIASANVNEITIRPIQETVEVIKVQENVGLLRRKKRKARAKPMLHGISKASLSTDSFLSAASFQQTTHVLTKAAVNGMYDDLKGLKENVIIGHCIPAGTGLRKYRKVVVKAKGEEEEKTPQQQDIFGGDEAKG